MNTIDSMNTNIEDYSMEELLNILELDNPNIEEIIEKIQHLNNNIFNKNEENK